MNQTVRHFLLGVTTGVTVFAIVVPLAHLAVALAASAGVDLAAWDNPVEVFIFLVTVAMFGVFPWGLWILLTDARKGELFDENHEVAAYLLAAIAVFVTMTILVCTRLQPIYEHFRWFFTPALLIGGVALLYWRWSRVWRFPTKSGLPDALDHALALRQDP